MAKESPWLLPSPPGTGRNVGVPSTVVETIGRRKHPLRSNSCADIFLTGVVDPEPGALAEELVPDVPERQTRIRNTKLKQM